MLEVDEVARIFQKSFENLNNNNNKESTSEMAEFYSGMVTQLQNLIMEFGERLGISDWNQWYYDCGMRVCGTPQVPTCDWCNSLST
jgi:hypothetical protein